MISLAPIVISIVEPTGRDRAAYNFLKTKNVKAYFFYGQGSTDPETFRHFEDIANQFSDTTYGDYAAWVVATKYRYQGDNIRAKQVLSRLILRPDFVFKEQVRKLLEKIENAPQQ